LRNRDGQAASNQDQLGVVECAPPDHLLLVDGGAVARVERDAGDLDRTLGRYEIAVTLRAEGIFGTLAGLQRRSENPRKCRLGLGRRAGTRLD
jgi:hypothetical protein